jgi:hypothetical protein
MKRFWVSWWSGYYTDEGCTEPPYQCWESGERDRAGDTKKTDVSLCAVIDANSQEEIEASLQKHFPDYELRFCNEVEPDYVPGNRFPGFEDRTNL